MDKASLSEALAYVRAHVPTVAPGAALAPVDDAAIPQVKLSSRVVREAMRDTWFVVNEDEADADVLPIALRDERAIRRVHVNGEVAEFSPLPGTLLVRPLRPLRVGAGTIVVVNYR